MTQTKVRLRDLAKTMNARERFDPEAAVAALPGEWKLTRRVPEHVRYVARREVRRSRIPDDVSTQFESSDSIKVLLWNIGRRNREEETLSQPRPQTGVNDDERHGDH